MRTIIVLILLAIAGVTDADSLLEERVEKGSLERCIRRCEKNHPAAPTATPRPTVAPLPCEPMGGEKTFTAGQPRMFCFDAAAGSTFVEVASTSPANVGCAYFQSELTSPSGMKAYTEGAYPMGTVLRVPGRHYFWVTPLWIGDQPGCNTYTFTVR